VEDPVFPSEDFTKYLRITLVISSGITVIVQRQIKKQNCGKTNRPARVKSVQLHKKIRLMSEKSLNDHSIRKIIIGYPDLKLT
jgi:hypothetical protein